MVEGRPFLSAHDVHKVGGEDERRPLPLESLGDVKRRRGGGGGKGRGEGEGGGRGGGGGGRKK